MFTAVTFSKQNRHKLAFYNRIDGEIYDFTSGQFSEPIVYQHILSSGDEAFSDTNEHQYRFLKSAFRKTWKRKEKTPVIN